MNIDPNIKVPATGAKKCPFAHEGTFNWTIQAADLETGMWVRLFGSMSRSHQVSEVSHDQSGYDGKDNWVVYVTDDNKFTHYTKPWAKLMVTNGTF